MDGRIRGILRGLQALRLGGLGLRRLRRGWCWIWDSMVCFLVLVTVFRWCVLVWANWLICVVLKGLDIDWEYPQSKSSLRLVVLLNYGRY